MFTGITRGTFPIVALSRQDGLLDYWVDLGPLARGLELGASVAIDGVCQTVVELNGTAVRFQAIAETLRVTTLGELAVGARVSVERSLRAGDEIGGHEVAGHVHGTATVVAVSATPSNTTLRFQTSPEWLRYLFPKGFVAVDGSSLTVGRTYPDGFEVYLIPETLRLTNLGNKREGDRVNIELDPRTVAMVNTVDAAVAATVAATVEATIEATVERVLLARGATAPRAGS